MFACLSNSSVVWSEQGAPSVLLARLSRSVFKHLKSSRETKTLTRGKAALGVRGSSIAVVTSLVPAPCTPNAGAPEVLLLKLMFVSSRSLQVFPSPLCRGQGLPHLSSSFLQLSGCTGAGAKGNWATLAHSMMRSPVLSWCVLPLSQQDTLHQYHPTLPSGCLGCTFSPKDSRVCVHIALQGDRSLPSSLM